MPAHADRTVHLAVGLDDAFAPPLAATVRSALDTLRPGWRIELTVLDGGVSPRSRVRLERSWGGGAVEVRWRRLDRQRVADLPVSGPWGSIVHHRLLLPDHVPDAVEKILYLDCDMVVRRDLAELWEEDCGTDLLRAAQDPYMPYFADEAHPSAADGGPRPFPPATPVPNHAALGLPGSLPYFNSGVLLMNLAAWRREDVSRRLLECLRANRPHVVFPDQYALNVVCAGRWGRLDPRWNRSSVLLAHGAATRTDPLHPPEVWDRLVADPWIVHYAIQPKPWTWGYPWPDRDLYFAALDRTDWAGWRPRRTWAQWWDRRSQALRRLGGRMLGGGRKAA